MDDDDEATSTSGGTVSGGGSGLYEYGEEVVLTAEPERCHNFVGWYTEDPTVGGAANGRRRVPAIDGLRLLSTDLTYTYTVGGELRLYPVFHRLGDVNGDGKFSIADVVLEANYIKGSATDNFAEDEADANNDGEITIADVVEIANSVMTK